MAERSDFEAENTKRPTVSERGPIAQSASGLSVPENLLPTVREVLKLDEVVSAWPEVLAGEDALDSRVRWVHVADTAVSGELLSGGELLLSTGVGWPENGLGHYVEELAEVGVAGLILELGARFSEPPDSLVWRAKDLGLPLIVLHRVARFISITEAVHARIISEHSLALEAKDSVQRNLTELGLRGSRADFIVSTIGRILQTPVMLEDSAHQLVAAELLGGDDRVLSAWESKSRQAHRESGSEDRGWLVVPVQVRGRRFGYLVALPGPVHPAGRVNVLEYGAVALTLSRLSEPAPAEWMRLRHRELLAAVLSGSYSSEASLTDHFEAAGIPVSDRGLVAVAVSGLSRPETVVAAAQKVGVVAAVAPVPSSLGGRGHGQALLALFAPRSKVELSDHLLDNLAAECAAAEQVGQETVCFAVGAEAERFGGLARSLESSLDLLRREGPIVRAPKPRRAPSVLRVLDRPLLSLLAPFGDDPRIRSHTERMLGALIEYDLGHDADLMEVLAAYLAYPRNRTRAASASHLSRSAFYQRIALIEEVLGVDLDDGETLSALHVALLAHGL